MSEQKMARKQERMTMAEYRALTQKRKVSQHKAGEMNRLERSFANEQLEPQRLAGQILDYQFEAVTLKLAKDTRYTPDFMIIYLDGEVEFVECKGFWRDDAKVKIKVAAEKFKHFSFVAVQRKSGDWVYSYF